MFQPDLVVLDFAPTARLAARILGIPTVLIGNGFELPPASAPLPAFGGFTWATADKAAESERVALANAQAVTSAFKVPPMEALCELFEANACVFATFAELDHYGARADVRYGGPLLGQLQGEPVLWPSSSEKHIFACLRPDTQNVEAILGGLAASGANVVCVAPGFTSGQLAPFRTPKMHFSAQPVLLQPLLQDADVCVSYGAEGTVATFLLAGVPQLLAPHHVEAQMAARRIEEWRAGLVLRGAQTVQSVAMMLDRLIAESCYAQRARDFSQQYGGFDAALTAKSVVELLESVLEEARWVD